MAAEKLPLPPPDFAKRNVKIRHIRGAWLKRIHGSEHDPMFFGTAGTERFDDPLQEYGVLYAAHDFATCMAEVFLKDVFKLPTPEEGFTLDEAEVAKRSISELTIEKSSLKLANLAGDGLLPLGGDRRVITTQRDVQCSQPWSRAIWLHPRAFDGIFFESPLTGGWNVALFDRAPMPKANKPVSLVSHPELGPTLDRYHLGVAN